MKRIVCDTSILVSGLLWKGSPREILMLVEKGELTLFTSRDLLEELERVLKYPRILRILAKAKLNASDVLRWVVEYSSIVLPRKFTAVIVKDDPADDIVLECGITAAADAIVSGDRHLLALKEFSGIPIIRAAGLLEGAVQRLKGMLPKPEHALSLEEMDRAIAKGAAESNVTGNRNQHTPPNKSQTVEDR
jgi:putative PIN family toxin of toxin-antitoxin system